MNLPDSSAALVPASELNNLIPFDEDFLFFLFF